MKTVRLLFLQPLNALQSTSKKNNNIILIASHFKRLILDLKNKQYQIKIHSG